MHHIAIPVSRLQESKAFYEKLGFLVFADWEKPTQNLKAIRMKDDTGFTIELIEHPENSSINFPKMTEVLHIGLVVRDLEATLEKLAALGIKTIIPITKGVSIKQFAFIKDPNGLPIELFEENHI